MVSGKMVGGSQTVSGKMVGDSQTVSGKMVGGSEGLNAQTFCTGLLFLA